MTVVAEAKKLSLEDEDKFIQSITGDTPLVVVIRAAIHIEHQVLQFIETAVVDVSALRKMKLTYDERAMLSVALGLSPRLLPPIRGFGTLRNQFAHKLESALGKSEIDGLYDTFAAEEKRRMDLAYQRTRELHPGNRPKSMNTLSPEERLALCISVLRSALLLERARVPARL